MNPELASNPPKIIMGRDPNRSTKRPTIGPATLPSARTRLKIKAVWALFKPKSLLMGPKKIPLLLEKIPPDNVPNRKVEVNTHHPK